MSTFRKIINNRYFQLALQIILPIATAIASIYYIHASVIVIRTWKIALIDLTFFLSAATLFSLCYVKSFREWKLSLLILFFLFGAGLFAAIFFPLQTEMEETFNTTVAAAVGVSTALSFLLACLVYQCIPSCRIQKRWESIIITFVMIGIYVGSLFLSVSILPHGWAFRKFSNTTVTFSAVSAEEMRITEQEKKLNNDWYQKNVLHAVRDGMKPAFDFSVGGKKLSETLSEWSEISCIESQYSEGIQSTVVLNNKAHNVQATVVSVYYPSTATFEWTVYLKNVGGEASETISDFYAMNTSLALSDPTLYFSGGSYEKNDDFALYTKQVTDSTLTFDTINGRTSRLFLPFFNLHGDELAATVGIGWSGDWTANFTGKNSTAITVSQTKLEGYLDPDEEIRSPLVSMHLYEGNPLKGFNTFRQRVKDSLPEGYGSVSTCFFVGAEGQDDTSNANEQGALEILAKFDELGITDLLNYAWFDAGWFETGDIGHWYKAIGDWVVDGNKYPNGFKTVTDALEAKDVGFLLWFEPERVPMVSNLYKTISEQENHADWLLYSTDETQENCLWNMGDPDARRFLSERISKAISDFGVNYYRQDFNIDPGKYWVKADETIYNGRKGFAENKYVAGEYLFLDYLIEHNPGLLIDNCASGGRRIDLEMCRRSIPLWRSDYNCYDYADIPEALQYQTYGLSMWLPYSAGADLYEDDMYEYRSHLGGVLFAINKPILEGNEDYVQLFRDHAVIKDFFDKQYYPLTSCSTSEKINLAMQFGDEKKGVILVYSREKAKEGDLTLTMNGLSQNKKYNLTFIEGIAITEKTGAELMSDGFTMQTESRTAYVILYSAKDNLS